VKKTILLLLPFKFTKPLCLTNLQKNEKPRLSQFLSEKKKKKTLANSLNMKKKLDQIFEIEKIQYLKPRVLLKNKRTDQNWLKPATVQARNGYMTKTLCSLFIKGRAKKVAPKSMKTKSHNQACPF
jgi:hypothetical protein